MYNISYFTGVIPIHVLYPQKSHLIKRRLLLKLSVRLSLRFRRKRSLCCHKKFLRCSCSSKFGFIVRLSLRFRRKRSLCYAKNSCGAVAPRNLASVHSHSIVAGGLLVISYSTRLTPCTSLTKRTEIFSRTS